MKRSNQSILFFDGDCGLCSRCVQFLLRCDSQTLLLFAPLQGSSAASLLPPKLCRDLNTAVYKKASVAQLYLRSDAVLQALVDTKSFWRIPAQLALKIPRRIRDTAYDFVAGRRKALFKKKTCLLQTEETGQRFLP